MSTNIFGLEWSATAWIAAGYGQDFEIHFSDLEWLYGNLVLSLNWQ